MIQAIGLTSPPRKELPPAVDDVSFEAHPGHVTALLGMPGAGRTTVLRLMLELQKGRGITYFRGRPLHRVAHPDREVGVLLGEVPGHPARTVRGHLRMLCAAAGLPARRADEVLEVVGLVSLREARLSTLSRGMDRRLGLACALLTDPHTLVLDEPVHGLSVREARWLHGILRAHATQGGTVLFTTGDPKEAARIADRVLTLEQGRLVADQDVADFSRTRLRPRVAVRTPHAARLGAVLTKEARTARRSVEIVREGGNRLSVYGSTCAEVGETAFRHGILVHQLADEIGDMGPPATPATAAAAATPAPSRPAEGEPGEDGAGDFAEKPQGPQEPQKPQEPADDDEAAPRGRRQPRAAEAGALPPLPPSITVRPASNPLRPVLYELRRATGVATGYVTAAVVIVVSAVMAVVLARTGHTPQPRLLAAWPRELPLPPAAVGAGLLGAIAFGDEFRYPALAVDRGPVPRRLGLLAAKLLVSAAAGLLLALLTVGCDLEVLYLLHGPELTSVPGDWLPLGASWLGLVVGCAWAGVLAAGVFRSTSAGLAAVVAVPLLVVPLMRKALEGPTVRQAVGFPMRLRELLLTQWPFGGERYVEAAAQAIAQPEGGALLLSLTALLGAYLLTTARGRVR
ncbi:ATP-binding cassette domain-containing protein [Streptomyces heilongjiangensis]|uniref:ATP-binding cassette domain-containing protein n=1 Tax=Streptomyces heilongjiangensis TaxID=945052 RepID=A0ABW1BBG4_9ACTN|nr:ATP-binding cassette domain-containing protein [Streptomyces heilongjiangensis]MDC2949004.1 ATP-binding cassette domain-containing protein [Streptomyces heilongjiangensis]